MVRVLGYDFGVRGKKVVTLPGCAAPLYVSLRSEGNVVDLTTKPGDPRQLSR